MLGALPPFDLELPWWQEAGDVVAAARAHHGVEVSVLRLLEADKPGPPGGHVTYLAEVAGPVPESLRASWPDPSSLGSSSGGSSSLGSSAGAPSAGSSVLRFDGEGAGRASLRAPWARPGGPAASVTWALAQLGRDDAVAVQQRTWNLSAIWRIDAGGAPIAWIKQVPAFFAHEPAVLRLLSAAVPGLTPALLATGDAGRMLLAHIPGEDRYGADAAFRAEVGRDFHRVQEHFAARVPDLIAAGVPDRRRPYDRFARVAAPWLDTIDGLAELLDELPARLAAIEACGMPDTLAHCDLHPGNVRESPEGRVIVDWGDSSVAHPAYDILRLTEELPELDAAELLDQWADRWRRTAPGCDPHAAAALLRPVAALRAAATYQDFLDNIEDSERPYHEADVPERLAAAVAAAGF